MSWFRLSIKAISELCLRTHVERKKNLRRLEQFPSRAFFFCFIYRGSRAQ